MINSRWLPFSVNFLADLWHSRLKINIFKHMLYHFINDSLLLIQRTCLSSIYEVHNIKLDLESPFQAIFKLTIAKSGCSQYLSKIEMLLCWSFVILETQICCLHPNFQGHCIQYECYKCDNIMYL